MDALDAMYLDATVDQLADILHADHTNDGVPKQALRAKALGIMATPALALAMQQQALTPATEQAVLQPALVEPALEPDPEAEGPSTVRGLIDPDTGRINRDPHHCLGHACGRVTVAPHKLRPSAKVYLHIDATDLTRLGGAVLVEKAGWISSLTLKSLLGQKNITIQPVIDLNTTHGGQAPREPPAIPPAKHQYRPTQRMREATQLLYPVEAFPYSHTPSRGLDLDHTVAYRPACRDPQTGIGQLAPLSRTVHRAKTVAAWHTTQRAPGEIVWTSPLGYQYLVTPERTHNLGPTRHE